MRDVGQIMAHHSANRSTAWQMLRPAVHDFVIGLWTAAGVMVAAVACAVDAYSTIIWTGFGLRFLGGVLFGPRAWSRSAVRKSPKR